MSGVFCRRSFAAALTVIDMPDILGWKMIATASKRGPVRRNSRSKAKKVRRILLAMVSNGGRLCGFLEKLVGTLNSEDDRRRQNHTRGTERRGCKVSLSCSIPVQDTRRQIRELCKGKEATNNVRGKAWITVKSSKQ